LNFIVLCLALIFMRFGSFLLWLGGGKLMYGPFQGLTYTPRSVGSTLGPKTLGVYEKELHALIASLAGRYQNLINIGAAEGYYAVGLALLWKLNSVIAFETEAAGRDLIISNAKANGLEKIIQVKGRCDMPDLQTALESSQGSLVLMDVEGAELRLLDPVKITQLRRNDILVETHDFCATGCTQTIADRFRESHLITEISTADRTRGDLPPIFRLLGLLFKHSGLSWMDEGRPGPMKWLFLQTKK
jgi:hypothetical protein